MSHIRSLLAHFRVMSDWAARAQATAELDVRTFELELRCRGRYWYLAPQFAALVHDRLVYQPVLTADAVGFSGWLPYRPRPLDFAADKLGFKSWLVGQGLRTPQWWEAQPQLRPQVPYLLKGSPGSFGAEVLGPLRAGDPVVLPAASQREGPRWYVEAFVPGRIVKAWFWGGRACFAHVHPMPTIRGDGLRRAGELVAERLALAGRPADASRMAVEACLACQGLQSEDVVPRDATPFVDYRYGQRYDPPPARLAPDDALPGLPLPVREQIDAFGVQMVERLRAERPAPVLVAADAMLDEHDRLWWLELNANPAVPPEAYAPMLEELFGFRPEAAPEGPAPPASAASA